MKGLVWFLDNRETRRPSPPAPPSLGYLLSLSGARQERRNLKLSDAHCSPCSAHYGVCASDGHYDQSPHPSPLCLQCWGLLRPTVCSWSQLIEIAWSGHRLVLVTPWYPVHSGIPPLQCSVPLSTEVCHPFISSDWVFMLILLASGRSYVLTLGVIALAFVEHNTRLNGRRKDANVAATVVSFCLVGGLVIGSLIISAVTGVSCQ